MPDSATTRRQAKIAHISDLHFGAIDLVAAEALGAAIADAAPDAMVITGDITQSGRRQEFKDAAEFLSGMTAPIVAVAGNHDAPVFDPLLRLHDPWRRFRHYIGALSRSEWTTQRIAVFGLNSARRAGLSLDWSLGRLSRGQIAGAVSFVDAADPAALRVIALHHPMLPGPGRAGSAVVGRSAEALTAFARAGADVILTGHVHIAAATAHETPVGPLLIVAAGTGSSSRLRGEAPSFNMITGDRNFVKVDIFTFADGKYFAARSHIFEKADKVWRIAR